MRRLVRVVVGMVVVLGVAAIGVSCSQAASGSAALELVPADSIGYLSLSIEEGSDQEQALEDLLDKFEKAPTLEEAKEQIGNAIFEAADLDVTYDADVQDWLGDEAAFFVQSFDQEGATAAGLIETTDAEATQDMMEEIDGELYDEDPESRTYEGVDYDYYEGDETASGFVEDFWVIGTKEGFEAVVDTSEDGRTLTDSDNFDRAVSELPSERLGLFFIDYERLSATMEDIGGASSLGFFGPFGVQEAGGAAGALYARSDAAVFEFASPVPEDAPDVVTGTAGKSGLLPDMPGDSWGALGVEELGESLTASFDALTGTPGGEGFGFFEQQLEAETGLELQDIMSWMGDAGAFVKGQSLFDLQAGLVIESRDPAKSSDAIDKLGNYLAGQGVPVQPTQVEGLEGFAIQNQSMPQPVNVLAGDKVVIAYGDDATSQAINAREPLSGADEFQQAADLLGSDFAPAFYMNIDTVITFAEAVGASSAPNYEDDVKPWLEPLTDVIAGSKIESDTVIQRFVIGVE